MRATHRYNRKLTWLWLLAMVFSLAGRPMHAAATCIGAMPNGSPHVAQAEASAPMSCGMDAAASGGSGCCCKKTPEVKPSDSQSSGHGAHHGNLDGVTSASCGCVLQPTPAGDPADSRRVRMVSVPDVTALPVAVPVLITLTAPAAARFSERPVGYLPQPDRSPTGSRAPPVR